MLYPPLTSTVARDRGPPSCTQTCLAAARHAPEGPRTARSCDGCAAPLALSGSGEHGPDVLSTPSAQLQAESSDRAVVTRERRWLVAEWNGPYGAHGESLSEACGSGRRCSPRPPPGTPSTIPCSPDLVRSVGPSGAALGGRGGLRSTCYWTLENERLRTIYSHHEPRSPALRQYGTVGDLSMSSRSSRWARCARSPELTN